MSLYPWLKPSANGSLRSTARCGGMPLSLDLKDQYLDLDNAEEQSELHNIARLKRARCRMLVVGGPEISQKGGNKL